MTEWHPLRSTEDTTKESKSWEELNRHAEDVTKQLHQSAEMPSLNHSTMKDYYDVYEPSDDTYLLLDGMMIDLQKQLEDGEGETSKTLIIMEIGTGSGVPITYLANQLQKNGYRYYAIATDINPKALRFAKKTATENGVVRQQHCFELIQCDLASPLVERLQNQVDILIYNPPYVPTPDEEIVGNGIEVSWAGGDKGRRVIDRTVPQIVRLLSSTGTCYMITVDDNEPEDISDILKSEHGMTMVPLVRRRACNEYLTVQKITHTRTTT
jgi:release factor glutamine methyltransferase